jgi:ribosomal protein L12E/L44/L45/RPP1/RPP2
MTEDISEKEFTVVLTGAQINAILKAVGVTTTNIRITNVVPNGLNMKELMDGCIRLATATQ